MSKGVSGPDGLVVVDKDPAMTSHDVVARIRRLAGTRKAGHGGTLDPMATGVLCVGLGRATKLLRYVVGTDKEYEATIRLGIETSTDDAEGEVLASRSIASLDGGPGWSAAGGRDGGPNGGPGWTADGGRCGGATGTADGGLDGGATGTADGGLDGGATGTADGGPGWREEAPVSAEALERIDAQIATMRGRIDQVPSSVSAVKVDGRRAYDRVRSGEQIELAARPVDVHVFERGAARRAVTDSGLAVVDVDVRVVCGAGTYIRALARDLGRALGTGGHLTRLRRTRVGPWGQDQAWRLPDLGEGQQSLPAEDVPIIGMGALCEGLFPRVEVSAEEAEDLAMGRFIDARRRGPAPSHVTDTAAAWFGSTPVALVSARSGKLKPDLSLRPRP